MAEFLLLGSVNIAWAVVVAFIVKWMLRDIKDAHEYEREANHTLLRYERKPVPPAPPEAKVKPAKDDRSVKLPYFPSAV